MYLFRPSIKKIIAIFSLAIVMQLSISSAVFANDPGPISPQGTSGDLSISISTAAKERAFAIGVTNNGTDDVISFTLDVGFTNYAPSEFFPLPSGFALGNSTDRGTYDNETGVWNGTIEAGQTVVIGTIGVTTGNVGETITVEASILSSTLGDSTPNIDPNPGNDSVTYETDPIILDPDLALETRLITTGEIEAGDAVQYELTISNVGPGAYVDTLGIPLGVYFIIPEGTTFVGVDDLNPADNLDFSTCGSLGNASINVPAFAGYNAELVGCQITFISGNIPSGYSFKINFNMTASGPFADGDTQVLAIVNGDETDSLLVQTYMYTPSTDPFGLVNNNTQLLTYDSSPLIATVNRCAGFGEVVTTNTACFTISFNKDIYEPSFDASDLSVTNAEIESLSQLGDNLWEIRLKNLAPNKVVAISISADNDILDYSAVLAGTQVLGINTVRYEVATLPETGLKTEVLINALVLIVIGFSLLKTSKLHYAKQA